MSSQRFSASSISSSSSSHLSLLLNAIDETSPFDHPSVPMFHPASVSPAANATTTTTTAQSNMTPQSSLAFGDHPAKATGNVQLVFKQPEVSQSPQHTISMSQHQQQQQQSCIDLNLYHMLSMSMSGAPSLANSSASTSRALSPAEVSVMNGHQGDNADDAEFEGLICTFDGCNRRFSRYYNLKSHLRTHTNERPFQCNVCDCSFSRQHDLKRHHNTHTGKRMFPCGGCGKNFSRLDAVNRHRSTACKAAKLEQQQLQQQLSPNGIARHNKKQKHSRPELPSGPYQPTLQIPLPAAAQQNIEQLQQQHSIFRHSLLE